MYPLWKHRLQPSSPKKNLSLAKQVALQVVSNSNGVQLYQSYWVLKLLQPLLQERCINVTAKNSTLSVWTEKYTTNSCNARPSAPTCLDGSNAPLIKNTKGFWVGPTSKIFGLPDSMRTINSARASLISLVKGTGTNTFFGFRSHLSNICHCQPSKPSRKLHVGKLHASQKWWQICRNETTFIDDPPYSIFCFFQFSLRLVVHHNSASRSSRKSYFHTQHPSKNTKTHKNKRKSISKLFNAQTPSIWFQVGSYLVPIGSYRFLLVL